MLEATGKQWQCTSDGAMPEVIRMPKGFTALHHYISAENSLSIHTQ
jgi:hypothetical protein